MIKINLLKTLIQVSLSCKESNKIEDVLICRCDHPSVIGHCDEIFGWSWSHDIHEQTRNILSLILNTWDLSFCIFFFFRIQSVNYLLDNGKTRLHPQESLLGNDENVFKYEQMYGLRLLK